jgi:hypothetical protein
MTDKKMSGKTHPLLGELTVDESWIIHCAVNDINWKGHLGKLTLEEVDRLLKVETRKTAIRKLKSRRRKLEALEVTQ